MLKPADMNKKYGTIVVSDTHITTVFDLRKYNYLFDLFSRCEQIIFNGDFWSYYSGSFDRFLNSKWNGLFELMKQKQCVYVHGNHDREKWCDERVSLFSVEACDYFHYEKDGVDLLITHGHLIANDSIKNETYIKVNRFINNLNKWNQSFRLYIFAQRTMVYMLGDDKYATLFKKVNTPHYKYAEHLPERQILVAAHTHAPEYVPQKRYINVGFINFGLAYFLNIQNGRLTLEKERYF